MKHFLSLSIISAFALLYFDSNAQVTVTMTDEGSITIPCGDPNTFLDGYNGAYGNNEDVTVTICVTPGEGLTLNLSFAAEVGGYFDIHESDTLFVYDGSDINSPLIAALNNGTSPFGAATANTTLDNLSGCVTLQFVTDGSDTGEGFQGEVSCNYSCQPIEPWFTTVPAIVPADSSGSINICLGDTVTLTAIAGFPMSAANNGPGYNQTLENSTIEWFIFGEPTLTGESITFIPDQRAGYLVDILITDTLNCFENARTRIQVSTIPDFSETMVMGSDTICPGETAMLTAGVTSTDTVGVEPTTGHFLHGGLFGEALELPDGSGTIEDIYTTTINITGFEPGDTITSGSDLENVCVSIEHSWIGDLEMWLTCPGSQDSITIFNGYNGNSGAPGFIPGGFPTTGPVSTNLGIPGNGSNQGTCWEYCFSITENEFGTFVSTYATNQTNNAVTSGSYLPEESFENLIGCPINGDWTLSVADNWGGDDGWICEWGIVFNPDIDLNAESYIPNIADGWWQSDPTIINTIGDTIIEVQPPDPGDYFYTFNVEDDFGCEYDTTIQVHMVPPLTSFTSIDLTCELELDLTAAEEVILGQWSYTGPVGATATFSPNELNFEPTVTVSDIGTYQFIFEADYCGQMDTVEVSFLQAPEPVVLQDVTVCPGDTISFDGENATPGITYNWNPGNIDSQILTLDSVTSNTNVTLSVGNDCGTENSSAAITVNLVSVSGPIETCLDDQAGLVVNNSLSGGSWSGIGSGDISFAPGNTVDNPDATVSIEGPYTFTYTDDFCARETSWDVMFSPLPSIWITTDTTRICLEDELLLMGHANTDLLDYFSWDPTGQTDDSLLISALTFGLDPENNAFSDSTFNISLIASNFCGDASANLDIEFVDCTLEIPSIFNPNSAGGAFDANGFFTIDALNLHPGNNVKIFDRWGRKRYDEDNYHLNPWDGKGASDGVFYYILTREGYEAETGYVHLVGKGS